MAFYSFTAIAQKPVGIPDPMVLLDKGVNVFTAETDDLDGLIEELENEGVKVTQVNKLDDHPEVSVADLPRLPGEEQEPGTQLLQFPDAEDQEAEP